MRKILAALGKIGILGLILVAFAFGLAGTVYLSLRSPNVTVPDVTSKTIYEGEAALESAGLGIRERARRYKSDVKPGIILDQFPRGGAVVKQGQTVAVIVSRAPKEGESPPSDEMVETEEEKSQSSGGSAGGGQNRERRRSPSNRNANANASPNANGQNVSTGSAGVSNGNANAGRSANVSVSLNANRDANRNANTTRNGNANDNRGRNANNRNANANASRNANTPRNGNSNRRPDR